MHTLVLNKDGQPMNILPISSLRWQDAVKAFFVGAVNIMHEYDNWEVHSPSLTMKVPAVVMANKMINQGRSVHFSSHNIFLRDNFVCQYCHAEFDEKKLTKDHVLPRKYGGKTKWDNITTACFSCNAHRGHNVNIRPHTIPYRPTYWDLAEKRKNWPLTVPHESWAYYLNWPEENITIARGKNSDANNYTDQLLRRVMKG